MKKTLLLFKFMSLSLLAFCQVDVTVGSGGTIYVSPSAFIVVDGAGGLDINPTGQLIMDSESNKFSSLYLSGTHTGEDAEYRRYANPHTPGVDDFDNDLLSPPVSGQSFSDFFNVNRPDNSSSVNDVLPATSSSPQIALFGPFEDDKVAYTYYTSTTSAPLEAGRGYLAASRSGSASKNLTFRGGISTTDVAVSVNRSTGRFLFANLIGNPFTTYVNSANLLVDMANSSAFDADGVVVYYDDKSGVDGADATNSWKSINNLNASSINIAPGQGFYVVADTDAIDDETFDIEADTRIKGFPTNSTDDFIAGRTSSQVNDFTIEGSFSVILSTSNNEKRATEVYFINGRSVSRDIDRGWDAKALSVGSLSLNTRPVQASLLNNPLSIQCLSSDDINSAGNDLSIPLDVNAPAGETYEISLSNIDLPSGAKIYLHDTSDGSNTELSNGGIFEFTLTPSEQLSGVGTFYLTNNVNVLNDTDFTFETLSIKLELNTQKLVVEGFIGSKTSLCVYDMTGRLMNCYDLEIGSILNTFDASSYPNGVYLVELVNDNNQVISQKVIK